MKRHWLPHSLLISRRTAIKVAGTGVGIAASGWFPLLERAVAQENKGQRHCIILWMAGGPSQMDTFDLKPGQPTGGEFKEISTAVPGLKISEHLPGLARHADKLAIVRSLNTNEGDHARGTYLVRTGQRPGGAVKYPSIASSLSKALGNDSSLLPNYFSIDPFLAINPDAFSSGFLGPKHAPASVSASGRPRGEDEFAKLTVDNLSNPPGIAGSRAKRRRELWRQLQEEFLQNHPSASPLAHDTVYQRAFRMMDAGAAEAFELDSEPTSIREAYGRGVFGQGCLVARRLVERGVPLVEITLGGVAAGGLGWDTHQENFNAVKRLSSELDAGWSTLMTELDERGLLQNTTILWIGEFGRTPQINALGGRDHFPGAWSCVFAGGGIKGGQAFGKTSADGKEVVENRVEIKNILATLCQAVGVNPALENFASGGRPIKLSEGDPITEILA
jgi:hypothetical protein